MYLLKKAEETKIPIQIIYINNKNQITQRVIKVSKVTDTSVKAYCYRKRQFRTFKLENVLSVGFVKQKRGA